MEEKLDKIIELLEKIEYNSRTYNSYAKWSCEQDEFLSILYNQGLKYQEIIAAIKEKFNIERTEGAISSRISRLGLHTKFTEKPLLVDFEPEEPIKKGNFNRKSGSPTTVTDSLYDDPPF